MNFDVFNNSITSRGSRVNTLTFIIIGVRLKFWKILALALYDDDDLMINDNLSVTNDIDWIQLDNDIGNFSSLKWCI